jgi:DNA-binding Lrp family transcriptional regulator
LAICSFKKHWLFNHKFQLLSFKLQNWKIDWCYVLDRLDRAIIGELGASCRMSFSELAEKYDVSVNTIKNRVENLIERKIILGFDVLPRLELLNASFASITLQFTDMPSEDSIDELGSHPFIMAISTGMQPEGFAVSVYRTNQELNQAMNHLRSHSIVGELEVFQLLEPPQVKDSSPTKTLDDLKKIDWKILHSLRWNGRLPLTQLAENVSLSVPTVRKRLVFMRQHNLIHESILSNIGAIERGLIITYGLEGPFIVSEPQMQIEEKIRTEFPNNFWLSWKVADRPIILLTFQAANVKEVQDIHWRLEWLFPESKMARQVISGQWKYFQDFRDDLIKERTK